MVFLGGRWGDCVWFFLIILNLFGGKCFFVLFCCLGFCKCLVVIFIVVDCGGFYDLIWVECEKFFYLMVKIYFFVGLLV
jgi:hypothetical protein